MCPHGCYSHSAQALPFHKRSIQALSHAMILPRRAKGLDVEDTPRKSNNRHSKIGNGESRQSDSNRRPADYKSAALPAELCRRRKGYKTYNVKTEGPESHCNFCNPATFWTRSSDYSRTREYAERGPAVSKFLITVLR